ncbi:MAG: calcium/sodium antiporter [Firmicutes bacterium]|nr:calcium/sodium antiporter [Bacillota bacterium]
MHFLLVTVLFIIGLVLIIKGSDFFVDAAAWFAEISGIPKFIVGATVVSFATTLPELLVSLFASLQGKNLMAAGNAVGSVTANIGLIMAISIVCIPAVVKRNELAFKGILMAICCALLLVFARTGNFGILPSVVMLFIFAVFMTENIAAAKKSITETETVSSTKKEKLENLIKFIIGTAGIIVGAQLLVDNGTEIARMLGVSDGIIAVTLIAVGTSLPELVTTITAIIKKQSSLSIGNIIGANIIDLSVILPVCSLVAKGNTPIALQTYALDIPVCLAIILIAIVPPLITKKFSRIQGVVLLVSYATYIVYVCAAM